MNNITKVMALLLALNALETSCPMNQVWFDIYQMIRFGKKISVSLEEVLTAQLQADTLVIQARKDMTRRQDILNLLKGYKSMLVGLRIVNENQFNVLFA